MKTLFGSIVLALIGWWAWPSQAQDVVRHPRPTEPLETRWAWAAHEARERGLDDYWVGYSIHRPGHSGSMIVSGRDTHRGGPSLRAQLDGTATDEAGLGPDEAVRRAARHALDGNREAPDGREVALLFRFGRPGGRADEVEIHSLSMPCDLEGRTLLWLGEADNAESVPFLRQQYEDAAAAGIRETLLAAIGVHEHPEQVVPFLQEVLTSRADDELRGQAAFWLGQQADERALRILLKTAREDRSDEVQEQAVFGISQLTLPAAMEHLIDLARRAADRHVREQAIFWLGQKASEQAVAALQAVVRDEDDAEVQEQAVFAISQLPTDEGLPLLIDLARTHADPGVRKQAIFWLGQSGDPRAVDVLVELVQRQ